jgi:hypothetical protein
MTKTMTSVRVVVTALGISATGCDVAFGLTGEAEPCTFDAPFDPTRFTKLADANNFSIAADRARVVLETPPLVVEQALPDGMPTTVFELANLATFALSPEGDALMYSTATEPPVLLGAIRKDGGWEDGKPVPLGTFAGTPSADAFGPRRVLVKLRDSQLPVQEYEDVGGTWTPVGEPFDVDAARAPSLTPSGLTMVFVGNDFLGESPEIPAVYAASRASTSEPFGEPRMLLKDFARSPQLLGNRCEELYISIDGAVRRYDR